jgi:hypothetical protein
MYDPTIGRWLEEDPKAFAAGDANLYRYLHNDPTNGTDPMGLKDETQSILQGVVADGQLAFVELRSERDRVLAMCKMIADNELNEAIEQMGWDIMKATIRGYKISKNAETFNWFKELVDLAKDGTEEKFKEKLKEKQIEAKTYAITLTSPDVDKKGTPGIWTTKAKATVIWNRCDNKYVIRFGGDAGQAEKVGDTGLMRLSAKPPVIHFQFTVGGTYEDHDPKITGIIGLEKYKGD